MKIKTIAAAIAALSVFVACEKTEEPGTTAPNPENSLTAPVITPSATEITITGVSEDVALKFSWTEASKDLPVSYTLICSKPDSDVERSFKCGTSLEKSFTAKEIDALKTDCQFDGDEFSLNFHVQAESSRVLLPVVSETVTVKFTYDIPVVYDLNLYPIGDCFEWGWDKTKAQKMETADNLHFTWTGVLKTGEGFAFKFLTEEAIKTNSWYPSYNRDADASEYWTLVERKAESDPDKQFSIEKGGECTITVDLEKMTLNLAYKEAEKIHIYGIGDAFDWGWKMADAEEFISSDNETFTWTGNTKSGSFKFLTSKEKWYPTYNRDKSASDEWTAFRRDNDGQPDDQFSLSSEGNWTISLNVVTLKVTAIRNGNRTDVAPTPQHDMDGLWLYGDVIPGFNWKLASMLKLTTTDNIVYTYEGELVGGEGKQFKFMCYENKWWPAFLRDGEDTKSLKMRYAKDNGAGDTPFFLSESGTYKLTADLSKMEVTLEKK